MEKMAPAHRLLAVVAAGIRLRTLGAAQQDDAHHDRRRLHQRHDGDHVSAVHHAGGVEHARGGQEGHRADRAVAGRGRGGVVDADLPAEDREHRERHQRAERDPERGRHHRVARDAALGDLHAAGEADRPQQVERHQLGHRARDAQVRLDQRRDRSKHEEEDGRADRDRGETHSIRKTYRNLGVHAVAEHACAARPYRRSRGARWFGCGRAALSGGGSCAPRCPRARAARRRQGRGWTG